MNKKGPQEILTECIEIMKKKGSDYQSETSTVRQADYYPSGVKTIYEIMHAKMLRLKSVMDKIQSGNNTNYESLEDSAKDLINYSAFFVSYCSGGIDGQREDRDIFNQKTGTVIVVRDTPKFITT